MESDADVEPDVVDSENNIYTSTLSFEDFNLLIVFLCFKLKLAF